MHDLRRLSYPSAVPRHGVARIGPDFLVAECMPENIGVVEALNGCGQSNLSSAKSVLMEHRARPLAPPWLPY